MIRHRLTDDPELTSIITALEAVATVRVSGSAAESRYGPERGVRRGSETGLC